MSEDEYLKWLLGEAAGAERDAGEPLADLERGRAAARQRRRRRFRAGTAGLALAAVAGFGIALDPPATDRGVLRAMPSTGDVRLVDQRLDAAPYTFDLTPKGWSVEAQTPDFVTIVPDDGSASNNPDVFVGKLVILFDRNPPGRHYVISQGRKFWVGTDGGYTTISTRTRPGEPVGVVRVQFPDSSGWTRATMLSFLGSVHVGPGAHPGLG